MKNPSINNTNNINNYLIKEQFSFSANSSYYNIVMKLINILFLVIFNYFLLLIFNLNILK